MDGNDIILNGEIILEGDVLPHDFCQYMDSGCFSARMVREALSSIGGDMTIRVNSGGGSPYEGEAIRAAIEAHEGRVTVIIGGIAASAASLMIMSADRIEMTSGSFLMIHNPSSCLCGTAADLRKEANDLDDLARVYAGVYATRAGMDANLVMQLMNDETYFGPEDAVASGFVDAVVGVENDSEEPNIVAAMSLHQRSVANLRMCAEKINAAGVQPVAELAGTVGQQPAMQATTMENPMEDEENPAVENATPNHPPQAQPNAPQVNMQSQPDVRAIEERGRQEERVRQREIREMSAPFMASGQLTQAQVTAVIDEGVPAANAANRFMSIMASAEAPVTPSSGARINRDETDTRLEGLIGAMMRDYSGPGEQYRGMRVRGLAMELSGSQRGFSENDAIARGMRSVTMMGGAHGVSDFAYITTEVMNRTLTAEYSRRAANWSIVAGTPLQASDFRELHAVRFGGDFQLKTVLENGEYHEATLNDEAEGLKVERRGRKISLTFEAVTNDDMSAFTRIPREFAVAARVMENSMVWGLIRSNAVLKSDGTALFHTSHKNLASSGSAVSVATVGAARKAMWEQTAFGTKDADDFLQIVPDQLIVPPALETVAMQFAVSTSPTKDGDTNPYKNTITPHTVPHLGASAGGSDTAWYMTSSDLPPISVAYLDGYESPTVQTIEGMNPDKVTMQARHIFGSAPAEFRGAYKNAGS